MNKLALALKQCGLVGSLTVDVLVRANLIAMADLSGAKLERELDHGKVIEWFTREIEGVKVVFQYERLALVDERIDS